MAANGFDDNGKGDIEEAVNGEDEEAIEDPEPKEVPRKAFGLSPVMMRVPTLRQKTSRQRYLDLLVHRESLSGARLDEIVKKLLGSSILSQLFRNIPVVKLEVGPFHPHFRSSPRLMQRIVG